MYLTAYLVLFAAFLASLGCAAWICLALAQGRPGHEAQQTARLAEWINAIQCGCFFFCSGVLLQALVRYDFTLTYVFGYTDRLLPLFYRLTAFWGGQEGSLLFWTVCVVFAGLIFQMLPRYARLGVSTRLWYWLFYFSITAFFCILMLCWSNPFAVFDGTPADGRGLNPLLQNPGMIFHPPLLFMGYAGLTVPACLALAQCASRAWERKEENWGTLARPFTLVSWALLSAGILLGAWWSYMELGWGGYWAWDPVENSSFVPWLLATAAIHALIIQHRRDKLHRSSVLLMALALISCFFATYLVRSGLLQNFSLHSFADGGVGTPLLTFVILGTLLSVWCAGTYAHPSSGPVENPGTREGFLILTIWVLLALSVIITLATLWPVISAPFGKAEGLDAGFYNRVCLPLFVVLAILLVICPWLKWSPGFSDVRRLGIAAGVFVASGSALWTIGYTHPVAVLGMAGAIGVIVGCGLMLTERRLYRNKPALAACGVHLGVALIVLGVAFSGPFKVEKKLVMTAGEQTTVGPFTVTLRQLEDGETPAYGYVQAVLDVEKHGKPVGTAVPERRFYFKWQRNFAEADTIPSAGNEFYASLLSVDKDGRVTLQLSANPLINWIWVGSTILCLFPFIGLMRRKRESGEPSGDAA